MKPLKPLESVTWNPERYSKSTLFRSDALMLGVNAFEPGQRQDVHVHAGADKSYLVLSGTGSFRLGEDSFRMSPGELLVAPAGVAHGVENDGDERLVVLVTMGPAPAGSSKAG